MAKTFTAPFAQTPKTASAVVTAASASLDGDTPTNTVLLCTAGADGALLTRLSAIPRATVTASSLLLWISLDGGTTKRLVDSALMAAHTVAATTAIPVTAFSRYSEDTPERLQAGASLYVGSAVALAGGIVFTAEYTDF
jgi:hypothetical protein